MSLNVQIVFRDTGGAVVANTFGTPVAANPDVGQRVKVTATAPSNGASAYVALYLSPASGQAAPSGATVYWDGVTAEVGATDGSWF